MEMNWLLLRDLTTTRCFLIGANLQFFSIEKVINRITVLVKNSNLTLNIFIFVLDIKSQYI